MNLYFSSTLYIKARGSICEDTAPLVNQKIFEL
nr:MAG TPA: hypothetical protein [Caudoviricetes sp.]